MKNKTVTSPLADYVCAILFAVFTFLYIFFFQDDMLFYAQHVLSDGVTVYNPVVGAVIITMVAMMLSFVSSRFFANNLYFLPALFHLPSALVLAALTDIHIVKAGHEGIYGYVWLFAVIVFVALLCINRSFKKVSFYVRNIDAADMLRSVVVNLFVMLVMFLGVTLLANTDEMDHARLRAEMLISQNRYEEASQIGKVEGLAGEEFTMLRALSLGKRGEIGEKFFEYPVVGNAKSLMPSADNRLLILPASKVYQYVGGVPSKGMDAKEAIRLLAKRGQLRRGARDYKYLSCLIDKDLDGFVRYVREDNDSTVFAQKHYREALTLYNHLHSSPLIDYSLPEMDADFADFRSLMKKNPDKTLRENVLRDSYGNTYWFYYFFR